MVEGVILAVIALLAIVIPPKHDPAIRWKERNERRKKERQHG